MDIKREMGYSLQCESQSQSQLGGRVGRWNSAYHACKVDVGGERAWVGERDKGCVWGCVGVCVCICVVL